MSFTHLWWLLVTECPEMLREFVGHWTDFTEADCPALKKLPKQPDFPKVQREYPIAGAEHGSEQLFPLASTVMVNSLHHSHVSQERLWGPSSMNSDYSFPSFSSMKQIPLAMTLHTCMHTHYMHKWPQHTLTDPWRILSKFITSPAAMEDASE